MKGAKRERIYQRGGHRCVECGTSSNLTLDHIIPVSRGGSDAKGDSVSPEVEAVLVKVARDGVALRVAKKLTKKKQPAPPRPRKGLVHHRHCDVNYCFCECPIYLSDHPELAAALGV